MTDITRRGFAKMALTGLATLAVAKSATAAGHSATHNVTIKGMAFEPAVLTITPGDTVVFTNEDGAPHTATSTTGAFDTGRLNRGEQAALSFSEAGTYDYFCEVHPRMTGQIIVQ